MIGLANLSRTVVSVPRPPTTKQFESILLFEGAGGRGTETTVLLWFARLFTPLSDGEGLGVGPFLHKYTEMKLRCERHQITIWKHGFQAAKPRVSGRETKGFRVWNPWFCKWEVSTFKSERKEDENRGDCYYFNKCFVKICKTKIIKKCLKWGSFCINMQNHLYIYAKTSFYEHKGK